MEIYDDLISAGLLGPQDQRDAALMGLFNLGAQIGARGAARLSPTPPPLDLSKSMAAYTNSLQSAMQRGALAKKMRDEKALRDMFKPRPVNEPMAQQIAQRVFDRTISGPMDVDETSRDIDDRALDARYAALPAAREMTTTPAALQSVPAAMRSFIGAVGAVDPRAALTMAGNVLAKAYTPSEYKIAQTGPNSYSKINSKTGEVTPLSDSGQGGSLFGGTGITNQAMNKVLTLTPKIKNGLASPPEQMAYTMAFNYLSRPRTEQRPQPDGSIQFVEVPGQDMSAFPTPASNTRANSGASNTISDGASVVGTKLPSPPTQGQDAAAMFAARMNEANKTLDSLEKQHGKSAYLSQGQELIEGVPGVGSYLQRKSMTPAQQQYRAAALNWMMATLRDESGAAISIAEAERQYATYFPLPGDKPPTIRDKAKMREILTEQMNRRAVPSKIYNDAINKINPSNTSAGSPSKVLSLDEIKKKYGVN